MAREIKVLLLSDLSGEEASETVRFGWQGTEYEIDLTDREAKAFTKAMEPYVAAAQKVTTASKAKSSGKKANKDELTAIREWAKANGYKVSDRGRISQEIRDAYAQAQKAA